MAEADTKHQHVPLFVRGIENALFAIFAAAVVMFAVNSLLARLIGYSIPDFTIATEMGIILFCFFAATVASWRGKHLAMVDPAASSGNFAFVATVIAVFVTTAALISLALSLVSFITYSEALEQTIFKWKTILYLVPASLIAATVGMVLHARKAPFAEKRPNAFAFILVACLVGALVGVLVSSRSLFYLYEHSETGNVPEWLAVFKDALLAVFQNGATWFALAVLLSALAGTPLFVLLAGIAGIFILADDRALDSTLLRTFRLFHDASGSIWTIPIFCTIGFLLAGSGAGKRLIDLFKALFGRFKGGEIIVAVVASAFFACFTGASGITILALGPMLAMMLGNRYKETLSHGVVAASGALGLLFPPSLALIIYAIQAKFSAGLDYPLDLNELFVGALIPGLLLMLGTIGVALFMGKKQSLPVPAAKTEEPKLKAGKLALQSLPEIVIPVFILFFVAMGFDLQTAGAFTILYIIVVEGPIRRELSFKTLHTAFVDHVPVIGGTIVILFAARFLSEYSTVAGIPDQFVAWMTQTIQSPFLFLLFLNLALLVVGCFMDIISAIFVIAPLVIPLGIAYGIHPLHLGVVFITNMCIGFLTPPVGMNLFLASYAFKKPLSRTVIDVLPYFAVQMLVLALVTYIPWLSTAFARPIPVEWLVPAATIIASP